MKRLQILLALPLLFLLIGCTDSVDVGPTQTDSKSVELGGADSVDVTLNMGVGELNVVGGASNLMDAEFTYNVEDWRPDVDYKLNGSKGELNVSQPDSNIEGIPNDDLEYNWDIVLQDDVPLDLKVDLGIGEANLVLGGLALQSLTVDTGISRVVLDLTGTWEESFNVDIAGGVGEVIVYLPEGVGLQVEVDTGIGDLDIDGLQQNGDSYTNAAYGNSDVSVTLNIDGGIGKTTVQVGR